MSDYKPTEYIVDFGDYRSSRFVELSMALIEQNGAKLGERIVRCRDCRYYHAEINACDEFGDIWHDKYANVEQNGFCSWAERREQ